MFSDRIVSITFTANCARCPDLPKYAGASTAGPSAEERKRNIIRASKTIAVLTRLQRKLTSGGCSHRCSSKSFIRHTYPVNKRWRSSRSLIAPITPQASYVRNFASKPCPCCPCPCPCPPCGACGTLPPPCNQPPRCIQCMTGYYYYPYGYWFCGPYHVTGQCCPVGPGGICPKPPCCPPCPACVCPPTAAAVMPALDQSSQASPSERRADVPFPKPSLKSTDTSISDAGARKAGRTSISNFFPFHSESKKERKTKSGPSRKTVNPTLQSSFFCVPYNFNVSNETNDSIGADRAKCLTVAQNLHVRNARHHSHVASCRPKRCKYMGYINPLTLPKESSDNLNDLNRMDSKQ